MCVCACGFPCVNHAEHRLLETLSKSPQCDNWLPRVAVSLLIIIVISCSEEREREKKKKGVRSMTLVGRFLVPLKKLISSLPELWRSFPAITQTVQIQCDQPSGPPCAGIFVTMLMLMSKQKSTCVTTVVSTEYILGLKHKAASWGQESFTLRKQTSLPVCHADTRGGAVYVLEANRVQLTLSRPYVIAVPRVSWTQSRLLAAS